MPHRQRTPLTLATPAIPPLCLCPHNTALLIQDMQYNLTHPQHGLGRVSTERGVHRELAEYYRQLEAVVENILLLKDALAGRGMMVVYTCLAHALEQPPSPLQRALGLLAPQGADEAQLQPRLAPTRREPVFYKRGLNAFHDTELNTYLKEAGITNLMISGAINEFGIRASAGSAQDLGFAPLLISDGTASLTQAAQTRTLQELAYGMTKVRSAGEVLTYLTEMEEQGGKLV